MKTDIPLQWHRLFSAALNDQLSDAERVELAAVLKSSAEARQLWFLYQDNECSLANLKPRREVKSPRTGLSWISWRPVAAAAAGLVLGVFSASLVYGMRASASHVKRQDIAIAEPGFEHMQGEVAKGFPSGTGAWTADDAEVVAGPDGGRVLGLRPWEKNPYSRVVQIVDVSHLTADGEKELVLAASFRTSDPQHASRYKLRLFGFTETADAVPPFPLETKESGIVTLSQVLDVPAGTTGWQRFSTKMPMPAGVRSVVVWIGASTRPQPGPKVTHFVDDVTLTLDVHQPVAR
ncbi:MAG: hypothetical protein RLZZ399_754 [Verrucomicrobiota bacterium]|jgi:hypothetical protein